MFDIVFASATLLMYIILKKEFHMSGIHIDKDQTECYLLLNGLKVDKKIRFKGRTVDSKVRLNTIFPC